MALVALSPQEIGMRVRWLRIQAGWTVASRLALEIGETKDTGIFTKLEKGVSITPTRLGLIAQACAGRGNIVANVDYVLGFLHGTKDQRDVWIESTGSDSTIPGSLIQDAA